MFDDLGKRLQELGKKKFKIEISALNF